MSVERAYDESEIDPVLRAVCSHWITKIKASVKHKDYVFQDAADDCNAFYAGPKNWGEIMSGNMGMDSRTDKVDTQFKVTVNKTFEFVTIFGPAMYFENPVRTVKPRMPVVVPPQFFGGNIPMYQAMVNAESQRIMNDGLTSVLLEAYLNWTPIEFNLGDDARLATDEALIKGRGCLWTELYSPPGTDMQVVRSTWDSVDHLFCDPDAYSFGGAAWIARKCIMPVWEVERDFGLRPGSIKGNLESQIKQADVETSEDGEDDRKRGKTSDLLVFYKIYSKMGLGGRLNGINKAYRQILEPFGDYCYLCVAENVQFPLNLPPEISNDPNATSEEIFARAAWPTPFWGDDSWPVSELDFHKVHNCPWPMPHLKAGMGELKFLNWVMSFLMGRIRNSSRDFVCIAKAAGEEIKNEILSGKDLTLLELEADHKVVTDLVSFLQHPQVNGDVWKMIEAVEANFDKRVGLTELMYGQQGATQIRSAQEATLRNQNMNVRPDDMRKQVETWMSRVAAKEAVCARYHLMKEDVQPALGQMGATAWQSFVYTRDVNKACRQLEYRIEAGSTQRPNKEFEQQAMSTAMQTVAPIIQQYAMATGDFTPLNNLLQDYAKSQDLDPNRYALRAVGMAPQQQPGAQPQEDDQGQGHQSPATTNIPPPG